MSRMQLTYIFAIIICSCNFSPSVINTTSKTTITAKPDKINFGKVKVNTDNKAEFVITNTGEASLTIYDIKTSCGCTVADWDKRPLKSGKSTTIKITHKDKYPGVFKKTITVYGNLNQPYKLNISGELTTEKNIIARNITAP